MAFTEKIIVGYTTKNEQIAWEAINVKEQTVSQVPTGWTGTSDPSNAEYPYPELYQPDGEPSVNLYTVHVSSTGTVYDYEPPSLIIGTFIDGTDVIGGGRVGASQMLGSLDATPNP